MYKSLVSKTIIILLSFLIIVALLLPILLKSLGLHPDFDSKTFELDGKKALIVASSHDILNLPGEVRGKPTGVASPELTVPYYEFMNSGMDVDLASIKGGEIPIDPEVGKSGDNGKPIVEENPDNEISKIYLNFAKKIKSTYL